MNWVIEIQGRDSKSVRHITMNGPELRIGRAYDNDIILNDVFACPHHARLRSDDQGRLFFADLESLNGSYDQHHKRLHGDIPVDSGAQFLLGQTHIRVFAPDHPVAEAIPRHAIDTLLRKASHPASLTLLLAAVITTFVSEEYLLASDEFQLMAWTQASIGIILFSVIWALLWLTVSRLTKHVARFSQQLAISLAFCSLFILTDGITEFVRYNVHSDPADLLAEWGMGIVLLWSLLWLNLYTGLAQPPRRRMVTASLIALGLMGSSFLLKLDDGDFSASPHYDASLMPPALYWTGNTDDRAFLDASGDLFAQLAKQLEQ